MTFSPFLATAATPSPDIRVIALDLDGTLFSSAATVSDRNQAALRAAHAAGLEIVIATGRRHTYAMRQLQPLAGNALPHTGLLISSNGAVLRSIDHTLHRRSHLAQSACERLFAHLGGLRDALVVTFDCVTPEGQDQRGALVVEDLAHLHTSIGKWIEANSPWIERLQPIEQCLSRGEPIQMMLCGTVDRMRHAEAHLRTLPGVCPAEGYAAPLDSPYPQEIVLHRTEYPDRDLSILDILPAHTSKGTALQRLLADRGLRTEHLMAIGDNWNDLPMLSVAGTPVLMGNASADLHLLATERGWQRTATNDEDGVALAIESLLEGDLRSASPESLPMEALP